MRIEKNPTYSSVHISRPLTNVSIAYSQANAGKYIAGRIFPTVGVLKKSDRFYVYDRGDLLRSQAKRRAPGAAAEKGQYRLSDSNYECERWAIGKNIEDPTRANADEQFNLDQEATEFCTDQIELAKEGELISVAFTNGIWTGASSTSDMTGLAALGTTAANFLQWNDAASTPIQDIRGEMTAVESRTGYRPNKLTLGPRVWNVLADHPDVIARLGDNATRIVTRQAIASLLELDEIVVFNAVNTTSVEGQPTAVDYIAGKHALLTYTTPSPGLRVPTAGYTFVWTADGYPKDGARIKRYRYEPLESDVIEGESWCDFQVVAPELGAFFRNAVA